MSSRLHNLVSVLCHRAQNQNFQVIIPLAMLDSYQCALVELNEVLLSELKKINTLKTFQVY